MSENLQISYCQSVTRNPSIKEAAVQDHVAKGGLIGRAAMMANKVAVQVVGREGERLDKGSGAAVTPPVIEVAAAPPVQAAPIASPVPFLPSQVLAVIPEAPIQSYVKPKKVRVQMSGAGMGKVTLFLSKFTASENLVLMVFPLDGETAIIEPPAAGIESPVTIVYDGKTYDCFSMGLTAELCNELVVALPRIPSETR